MYKKVSKKIALILVMAAFLSAIVGGAALARTVESGFARRPEYP
jgi:hypothetical protein